MKRQAGGLIRLRGSVGCAAVEQSPVPNLTESAEPLDCHDGSAGVRVQSAGMLRRSGRLAGHLVGAWVVLCHVPEKV